MRYHKNKQFYYFRAVNFKKVPDEEGAFDAIV
jgi:hypothetical protein